MQIVGRTSSWIDPDAADPQAASSSCAALQQQLSWAAFLGLQAVLLPQPRQLGRPFNYAQVINQVGLSIAFVLHASGLLYKHVTTAMLTDWSSSCCTGSEGFESKINPQVVPADTLARLLCC